MLRAGHPNHLLDGKPDADREHRAGAAQGLQGAVVIGGPVAQPVALRIEREQGAPAPRRGSPRAPPRRAPAVRTRPATGCRRGASAENRGARLAPSPPAGRKRIRHRADEPAAVSGPPRRPPASIPPPPGRRRRFRRFPCLPWRPRTGSSTAGRPPLPAPGRRRGEGRGRGCEAVPSHRSRTRFKGLPEAATAARGADGCRHVNGGTAPRWPLACRSSAACGCRWAPCNGPTGPTGTAPERGELAPGKI